MKHLELSKVYFALFSCIVKYFVIFFKVILLFAVHMHLCSMLVTSHKRNPLNSMLTGSLRFFKNPRSGVLVKKRGVIHRSCGVSVYRRGQVSTAFHKLSMGFVTIMVFTLKLFHLKCLFFFQLLLIPEIVVTKDKF